MATTAASARAFSAPFPAPAKTRSVELLGANTDITSISFADRILFTITQTGSFAHWVHVPLSSSSDPLGTGRLDTYDDENALLPSTHLTATTILGGTRPDDEVFGQTVATTLASSILVKHPNEKRTLVLGLGLSNVGEIGKEGFDALLGAILDMI